MCSSLNCKFVINNNTIMQLGYVYHNAQIIKYPKYSTLNPLLLIILNGACVVKPPRGLGEAPLVGSRGNAPCGVQGATPLVGSRGNALCGGLADWSTGRGRGCSTPEKKKKVN